MTSNDARLITGGCLCGKLRNEARGEPSYAGLRYWADCRKASGSGFIPFTGFAGSSLRVTGDASQSRVKAFRDGEAVRNFCPACGGLVFGGIVGIDESHTIYAGSLDGPSRFRPTGAIFTRDRPAWVARMPEPTEFDTIPE